MLSKLRKVLAWSILAITYSAVMVGLWWYIGPALLAIAGGVSVLYIIGWALGEVLSDKET